jgi:hypothetical protein
VRNLIKGLITHTKGWKLSKIDNSI